MAFITLGLPGSGKTGVLRQEAWNYYRSTISARDRKRDIEGYPAGAAVLDADEVRGRLPEFQGGIGSGVVQLETASLTYGPIKDRLFKSAHSAVVYDTVGDPNYIVKEVALLAEQGFAVSVLLAKLPTELAVERAVARFLETGRFVPPEYIRGREGVPESALEAVRASSIPLEGWGIWDTTCRPADHVDGAGIFAPVQMGS
jgi:predicted ABC-type ATPase